MSVRKLIVLLRWATLIVAAILGLAVIASPWVAPEQGDSLPAKILRLFAFDRTTQRTAIFVALGLLATGVIFFRVAYATPPLPKPGEAPPPEDKPEE